MIEKVVRPRRLGDDIGSRNWLVLRKLPQRVWSMDEIDIPTLAALIAVTTIVPAQRTGTPAADQALAAVRNAPDKRVLVLCSYRNRHNFEDAVRAQAADRLVDMQAWLRSNLKGRTQ
jgi:hypothetical protein